MTMPPVGYKNPPIEHRFPPGVSGNPAGGKRGPREKKRRPHPFDLVTEVTVGASQVKMTIAKRLMLTARAQTAASMDTRLEIALQRAKDRVDRAALKAKARIERVYYSNILWSAGSELLNSNDVVQHLGIGRLLWPESTKPRMVLEPFIVQQAINRMERDQLTLADQQKIIQTTRCAWKLKLPDWWHADAKPRKRGADNVKGEEPPLTDT